MVYKTPKWTEIHKYPVTVGLALLAIGVTLAWWAKIDISSLFDTPEIRRGQLWRLATCVLTHLDILHLVFNIYWLWIFGSAVEGSFGHAKSALLFLLLAVGSSSFDFALDRGGLGLSGIGYGLFGLLYVLGMRDERFRGLIDQRTVKLFVGWFFLCIALTITRLYPVANVAHAAGGMIGALVGYAVTTPERRAVLTAAITGVLLFGIWGSTFGRPLVNLSGKVGYEEAKWGYEALIAGRNADAVRWLVDSVKLQPKDAIFWFDLGIAYERMARISDATNAYRRAHQLEPDNLKYSQVADPKSD